jgi:hypothetical protein
MLITISRLATVSDIKQRNLLICLAISKGLPEVLIIQTETPATRRSGCWISFDEYGTELVEDNLIHQRLIKGSGGRSMIRYWGSDSW